MASRWSQPDDFVFPGRFRDRPRERNSLRTGVLYAAVERANELLARDGRPPLPDGVTFHALRRTYAALRAELGEHPAVTAAQMGHRDPRMTLRVYTDVTGQRPRTRMAGVSGTDEWAPMGTGGYSTGCRAGEQLSLEDPETLAVAGGQETGATGLEPAASGVTGRRSNQLSYAPGQRNASPESPRD